MLSSDEYNELKNRRITPNQKFSFWSGTGRNLPATPGSGASYFRHDQHTGNPHITLFSGDDEIQKRDTTYEVWRFETRCVISDSSIDEHIILQATRKSARPTLITF